MTTTGKFGIFNDGAGNIVMRHYDGDLHPDAVEVLAPRHIHPDAMNAMIYQGKLVIVTSVDHCYKELRAALELAGK